VDGELAQTCGNCAHFDVELEACLELLKESGPGSRTTWKRQTLTLSGPIDKLQPSEWHEQPKPQDQCHFSDDSRWAPRQRKQGPDGI